MTNMMKQLIALLLLLGLIASSQAAPSDNLGRLFSRPAERNNLDVLRQNQKLKVIVPQENIVPEVAEKAAPEALPEPVTMQGYVKRSDGKSNTIWINNQPVQENATLDKLKIGRVNQHGHSKKGASAEGVDVKIPVTGKQIRLKPGQMYEPENNKIYEMQIVEKTKRLELEQSGVIDGNETPQ